VTFAFTVIANQAPPALAVATEFADCEAVACAGLPTGEYSVGGKRTFCDNDEAGGGWTRIWRLNDSSCEENGWTSGRNVFANGADPVGCRSGRIGCSASKDITSPSDAFGEVLGKNWAMWAFGLLDSFGDGDGVFVSAEMQTLWTFSLSFNLAGAPLRCPCDARFNASSASQVALQRINETAGDYICDAAAAQSMISPVFLQTGRNLCGPVRAGVDRRSFRKVLPEQLRRLPLHVLICKNQGDRDEDIKIGALDLFARQTPGFDRAVHCVRSRTGTGAGETATTATPPTSAAVSTSSAAQPTSEAMAGGPGSGAIIAGVVGGSIGTALLVAVIFVVLKRSRSRDRHTKNAANVGVQNQRAHYGQLSVIPAPISDYDVGNLTLPPES
jgi:hypothetical protein